MPRKTGRTPTAQRLRRHLGKVRWCALCGTTAIEGGRAMEWLDPLHEERKPVVFVLCRSCALTNYREQLNQLHRQTWEARQAVQGRT